MQKSKYTVLKLKFLPAIFITLLLGFNNKAVGREIAVNSYNNSLTSQIAEMNRRSIVSLAGTQTQELIAKVQELVAGYNNKDIPAVIAVVDSNSSEFDTFQRDLESLFEETSFDIAIEKIEFVEVSQNKAKIRLTYDSTMRSNNKFYRDRYTDTVVLKKFNNEWKFAID